MAEKREHNPADLRRRAEARLRVQARPPAPQAEPDLHRLVAELQVHQAELEIQNEELQQSRLETEAVLHQYSDLYDFAPVSYLTLDREGVIRQANLTASVLLGVERSRLAQRRFSDFVRSEYQPRFAEFLTEVFAGGSREVCEAVITGRGGLSINVQIEAIAAEDGRSCRAVVLDITDRKRAEDSAAARRKEEQGRLAAEEAGRAKDRFLAVLSHELRTPLTPVLAAVSMLQKQPAIDPRILEKLEVVRRNVEMEARLIDDLLDITRISNGKVRLEKHPVDIRSVINLTVDVCRPDVEARKLKLSVHLGPDPCVVEGDPARLQQVVWNLVRNAVKFTLPGGSVSIGCRAEGTHAIIEVSDSGIGIEPEAMGQIFNTFEQGERTTTRQFGGLGLGLSISRGLVEMHGGTIEAFSEGRGKGATFTVRLPRLSAASAQAVGPVAGKRPQVPPRLLNILVVEDHGDTAELLEFMLVSEGHQVQRAADVATGFQMAMANHFDLLISDLGLPDASGIELMRRLRKAGSTLPGIALSGYGQERDVRESLQAGFAAHVVKPVDMDRLLEVVSQAALK